MPVRSSIPPFISVRSLPVGGPILTWARVSRPRLFADPNRVLMLVHGFNVSEDDAHSSYSAFEGNLGDLAYAEVVRVYWPGDARWLSKVSYMRQPRRARESAQRLVQRLRLDLGTRATDSFPLQPPPLEISIIAHSLGSRLALKFLEGIYSSTTTTVKINLVVLMAAAVPHYDIAAGGDFNIMMGSLQRVWVLQSTEDVTLRRWFRLGQVFERPWGSTWRAGLRGALGRNGRPGPSNINVLAGDWDHSDYWPDADIADAVDHQLKARPGRASALDTLRTRLARRLATRRVRGRHLDD